MVGARGEIKARDANSSLSKASLLATWDQNFRGKKDGSFLPSLANLKVLIWFWSDVWWEYGALFTSALSVWGVTCLLWFVMCPTCTSLGGGEQKPGHLWGQGSWPWEADTGSDGYSAYVYHMGWSRVPYPYALFLDCPTSSLEASSSRMPWTLQLWYI